MSDMTLLERVEAILVEHGIVPKTETDEVTSPINCGLIGCKLTVSCVDRMMRLVISFPLFVPDHYRLAMAECLCRINLNMFSGALELDMADGELRFRNALPIIDGVPTDEQLTWLVFWSWGFVRRYCQALVEVAVGACEPEVAVAKIEAGGVQLMLEERQG